MSGGFTYFNKLQMWIIFWKVLKLPTGVEQSFGAPTTDDIWRSMMKKLQKLWNDGVPLVILVLEKIVP